MGDLVFSSYLQGPLGAAIEQADAAGALPAPVFAPAVRLAGPAGGEPQVIGGPHLRLLGPGHVAGLAPGTVVRTDPTPGAADATPNCFAVCEVAPPELPWLLTPARPANGRLRPWLVLVVLPAAAAPLRPGSPLPTVEADVAELPDLGDSWGWAHVQHSDGAEVARLMCPRRLAAGVTYRACLVPAFRSGVAAGLGDPAAAEVPHEPSWSGAAGTVRLPVYFEWTFTAGPSGDFEQLVRRLAPADADALRAAAVRPVDIRDPWPGDAPLSAEPQPVYVAGALAPFGDPVEAPASGDVLHEFDHRIREHVDATVRFGALAPPLYGGRHVSAGLIDTAQDWLIQLNTSVANRVAAGLGADYVRANQEDLMAAAWDQVGAIREANRRRAVAELTTEIAVKAHERHVAALLPGEVLALAAPANERTRTTPDTTLAMETRMSRMVDGAASSAFARRLRPAGKLARATGISARALLPRALAGEVTVPAGSPVLSDTAPAARQLVTMSALARVAAVNNAADGGRAVADRVGSLGLDGGLTTLVDAGGTQGVAAAAPDAAAVTALTRQLLVDMRAGDFGAVTEDGVPVAGADLAARVAAALHPGDSHLVRHESCLELPDGMGARPDDPVLACPEFPVPTALALLESDPEWLLPGMGAFPTNRVALLRPNGEFIESYLAGLNHEMMRELLWREYPTDRRGTAFARFWPRPDGAADIPPLHTWTDPAPALGARLTEADALSVLLVRGDVVRRYPGMTVTAVRSTPPDAAGHHRPDRNRPALEPSFVIRVDDSTIAYAFAVAQAELTTPASADAPGWFFVFAEHGFRVRFGFDENDTRPDAFTTWNEASWPVGDPHPTHVPMVRGHAAAGVDYGSRDWDPRWNRDSADVARVTLQRPFRVAIQADRLLRAKAA